MHGKAGGTRCEEEWLHCSFLEAFVLETKEMAESHTAENIALRLSEVMDAYAIPGEKRVATVHDNASNMTLCLSMLTDNPSWGTGQSVRCAGHTLQLCINAALEEDPVCRTIAAARRLVSQLKKSTVNNLWQTKFLLFVCK